LPPLLVVRPLGKATACFPAPAAALIPSLTH
jgi:hypothetical protein